MRILITAGSTREPIDPDLFVGHSATGPWGIGAAIAAAKSSHRVTLLLGAWDRELTLDPSIRVYRFLSSAELRQLLGAHQSGYEVILHACSMTPYRPTQVEDLKVEVDRPFSVGLEPTPDLLAQIVSTKRDGQRLFRVRIGPPAGHPAPGVDADIWQAAGDDSVSPTWVDADSRETVGILGVDAWGHWVVKRLQD